jgi:hypothetical protein
LPRYNQTTVANLCSVELSNCRFCPAQNPPNGVNGIADLAKDVDSFVARGHPEFGQS